MALGRDPALLDGSHPGNKLAQENPEGLSWAKLPRWGDVRTCFEEISTQKRFEFARNWR
jgi:hypothetical protein